MWRWPHSTRMSNPERLNRGWAVWIVTKARLCFSCLSGSHMTRHCWSRNKCNINGCQRFHHTLWHTDHPTASGVASVADRKDILPLLRVFFRAASGQVREENVLIDNRATMTVICNNFAVAEGHLCPQMQAVMKMADLMKFRQSTWRLLCKLHQQRWAWHVGDFYANKTSYSRFRGMR